MEFDQHVPFFRAFGQQLVDWAQVGSGHHVLDVGVGRGANLFPAAARVGPSGRVVGIDAAAGMITGTTHAIRAEGLTHAQVALMDAACLDFPDCTFDRVLSGFTLHMLPDPTTTLSEIYRVLNPGGIVALSLPGPHPDRRWDRYGELIGQYVADVDRARWPDWPAHDWSQLLGEAGFTHGDMVNRAVEIPLESPESFWRGEMAHGMRGFIEALPPTSRAAFQDDVLGWLRNMEPLTLSRGAWFYKAEKLLA